MVTSIAVTGASGFLGRYVLAFLAGRDIDIVATARTVPDDEGRDGVCWVALDIHHPPADPFEALGRPDVLLHLAWGGLPDYRGAAHLEAELPAQFAFLKAMVDGGLKSMTVTGTCLEYGMQSGQLCEAAPCEPILPYPQAKLELLRKLEALKAQNPFSLTWARLFYMFGEGQQTNSLYSGFNAARRRGEQHFDMSGGQQLRDFLPVGDVADYLCRLALSADGQGLFNVCSGMPVKIEELVRGWAEDKKWDAELRLGVFDYPDYEPMAFWGDNSRLKEVLGSS